VRGIGRGSSGYDAKVRPISQKVWDERIVMVGARWLGAVASNRAPVEAECLACGHRWMVRPGNVQQGKGCPACAGQAVSQADRDAQAKKVGVRWLEPVKNAHTKTQAECMNCSHNWAVSATSVASGSGCPACWNKRRGLDKLKSQQAHDQAAAAVGIQWLEPVKRNTAKTGARCLNCHLEWQALPSRVQQGGGCPKCGIEKNAERQRLSQAERDNQAKAVGVEWLEPVKRSSHKALARCLTCGHQWKVLGGQVTAGHGCPKCWAAARRVPQAERDRQAKKMGLRWLEPVTNASHPTLARCNKCDHEWRTYPDTVSRGSGCPACAERGFNPEKPAYVYLLIREDGVAQVGITGGGETAEKRLRRHRANGYRLVRLWSFPVGSNAREVEQQTIRQWREQDDLLPAAAPGEDGWTETVHIESLPLREIAARIDDAAKSFGGRVKRFPDSASEYRGPLA